MTDANLYFLCRSIFRNLSIDINGYLTPFIIIITIFTSFNANFSYSIDFLSHNLPHLA